MKCFVTVSTLGGFNMNLFEIRFHGRGGQGAVTGAKILGDATRMENKHFQAFAHYGAERRGAPVMAFTRIADEPIRIHSYIYEPEAIVVLDETLLDNPTVQNGIKEGTFVVINTPKLPKDIRLKVKTNSSEPMTSGGTANRLDQTTKPSMSVMPLVRAT